jgi:GntR family transcriptional regulator/GntR family frlABCD operon transcriptional regulator
MAEVKLRIPQHKKIYELLRKHIIEGVYQEGDILPSENELCRLHQITRPTVRHALMQLAHDGLIRKHQGKGSIVHRIAKDVGILSIYSTTSALGSKNLRTKIINGPVIQQWPKSFMYELSETELESGCIYLERIRLVNDVPLFYDISYLVNVNLPRFCSRSFEDKSLFDIMRKHYSIEVLSGQQRLQAIPVSDKMADFLQIKKGKPILHLERKIETSRINFYIYSELFCNTENFALFGSF